ncbi:MAG: hypothetical protein CBC35_07010 [Planctomycetes bacterium TMED75]|nr:hypothetical protein [Planctomycetaceae bacterium]OUU92571.1 MAG: hypothetical protein CBC35_07010 [Planctomycetes bacterium TMED75]
MGSSQAVNADSSAKSVLAWKSPLAWLTLLLITFLGLGLDLWSKHWAFENVAPLPVVLDRDEILADPDWRPPFHEGLVVLPFGLLDFDLVMNHGAVFGIGQQRRSIFIVFTLLAVVVATSIFAFWTSSRSHWVHVGIGLILAGGLGNLYDRIAFGAVRDFLHMTPKWNLPFSWSWPNGSTELFPWVFNVADMLLLAGMGILIIRSSRDGKQVQSEDASPVNEPDRSVDIDQKLKG